MPFDEDALSDVERSAILDGLAIRDIRAAAAKECVAR